MPIRLSTSLAVLPEGGRTWMDPADHAEECGFDRGIDPYMQLMA